MEKVLQVTASAGVDLPHLWPSSRSNEMPPLPEHGNHILCHLNLLPQASDIPCTEILSPLFSVPQGVRPGTHPFHRCYADPAEGCSCPFPGRGNGNFDPRKSL